MRTRKQTTRKQHKLQKQNKKGLTCIHMVCTCTYQRIDLADVAEKLVAQPRALRRPAHQPCNIDHPHLRKSMVGLMRMLGPARNRIERTLASQGINNLDKMTRDQPQQRQCARRAHTWPGAPGLGPPPS